MKPKNCKQWSSKEDQILKDYVENHGAKKWDFVGVDSGLNRTGKSCRLRWLNHLKPGVKKGPFSDKERKQVLEMHSKFGKKWSKMAKLMDGRSDNDIKNFWHTNAKRNAMQGAVQRDASAEQEAVKRDTIAGYEAMQMDASTEHVEVQKDVRAGHEAVQREGSLSPIWDDVKYDHELWEAIYDHELWDAIEVGTPEFPSVQNDEPVSLGGVPWKLH